MNKAQTKEPLALRRARKEAVAKSLQYRNHYVYILIDNMKYKTVIIRTRPKEHKPANCIHL